MSTAVEQAVACVPVTQRGWVRPPVGTSFVGENFFSVFFLTCKGTISLDLSTTAVCQLKSTVTSGSDRWGISLKLPSGSGRPVGIVALLVTRVAFCCQVNLGPTVRTMSWSFYFLELNMSCFVHKEFEEGQYLRINKSPVDSF